ncbi:hypothetical protein Tco_0514490 [Tanacetum coccineum]
MMVQALEDMGEDSAAPTDSHSTPIITQPSSSKAQKKKSRRKQRKDIGPTEPIPDVATNEEPTSTPSCDPPQSEEAKTAQAKEIASLKKRVQQLEKRRKSRTLGLKRLRKGRKIANLDADTKVTLIDETQERFDEEMLFDVQDDLQGEEVIQIALDEELALRLRAKEQAELEKESVTHQEASREAIIEELESIQAMIDVDKQLAAKLQAEEQEQFSIEEKSRMLVEVMCKGKVFVAKRAAKQRSKPPTKNQIRNRMCTYLKNMGEYKHNQLKGRSYEEIQKLFDKAYKQVSSFVPMNSEVVKSNVTRTEGSSKRAGDELESDEPKN